MYYYTKEEAEKVRDSLYGRHYGKIRKYEPEMEGKVIDIVVQESGFEIANFGNVEPGYYVIISFEKHSGLVPAVFCPLNGEEPINATHEGITPGTRNQIISNIYMRGKWQFKDADSTLVISISDSLNIQGHIKGKDMKESFSSNGHWVGYYAFIFMDAHFYVLLSASELHMTFAQLKVPRTIDENYEWKERFDRIG